MTMMAKLLKAMFTRLRGDTTLMASVTGVFDSVPEGQKMPYIVLADITEEPEYYLNDETKWEDTVTLYIWSESTNSLEELDILELVEAALDAPLEITGYKIHQRLKKSTTERQSNYIRYLPINIIFKVEVA